MWKRVESGRFIFVEARLSCRSGRSVSRKGLKIFKLSGDAVSVEQLPYRFMDPHSAYLRPVIASHLWRRIISAGVTSALRKCTSCYRPRAYLR